MYVSLRTSGLAMELLRVIDTDIEMLKLMMVRGSMCTCLKAGSCGMNAAFFHKFDIVLYPRISLMLIGQSEGWNLGRNPL